MQGAPGESRRTEPVMNAARQPKPKRMKPVENIDTLLDNICGQVDCGLNPLAKDQVTIRELLATVGRRS